VSLNFSFRKFLSLLPIYIPTLSDDDLSAIFLDALGAGVFDSPATASFSDPHLAPEFEKACLLFSSQAFPTPSEVGCPSAVFSPGRRPPFSGGEVKLLLPRAQNPSGVCVAPEEVLLFFL